MFSQYTIHRSLRHLHYLGNVRYCSPRCLNPNDFPLLADGTFPHDEVKLTGHKKLTFGVAKVVLVSTLLFKDYIVNFTHFCQTCYQTYTHHIDNLSGSDSMSNTMTNKFGKFLQELFSRGVYSISWLTEFTEAYNISWRLLHRIHTCLGMLSLYTARQFYGVTLPLPPLATQLGKSMSSSIGGPKQHIRPLAIP